VLGSGRIEAFVDGGSALVAVGLGDAGPVYSTDGTRWSKAASFPVNPHDNAGPIAAATFWKDRFVIAASGQDFSSSGSTLNGVVWSSADGSTWQLEPEILHAWDVTSMTGNSERLVAVGYMCDSVSGPCNARAWTTTDLVTWSRADIEAGKGWTITHVIARDGGFVMLGRRPLGVPAAIRSWTSRDGLSWQRGEDFPRVTDRTGVLSLAGAPGGIVAVGGRRERSAVWFSVDGKDWSAAPDQTAFDAGIMTSVTAFAGGFAAVGGPCDPCVPGFAQSQGDPTIWRSVDGRSWAVVHPRFVDPPVNAQSMDTLLAREDSWILATHDWQNQGEETPMSIWLSLPEPAPA
jgi:hypothetical protein